MDKKTIMQNVMLNYSKYGVTKNMVKEIIEPLIDDGVKDGITYDMIYLYVRWMLDKLTGHEFYCTSDEIARAFGVSNDEMNNIIEDTRQELIEKGEDPDQYFKSVPVQRFMM